MNTYRITFESPLGVEYVTVMATTQGEAEVAARDYIADQVPDLPLTECWITKI
jgi:hypothetical protein